MDKLKKCCLALLCLCGLLFLCPQSVSAKSYLFDNSDLFTSEEEAKLTEKLDDLREIKQLDVVIVTTDSAEGKTSQAYADDFLDNGYGYGSGSEGILFLIDMEHREIYISTMGDTTIRSFSDRRIDKMLDDIYDEVSDGDYYGGARAFLDGVGLYANTDPSQSVKRPMTLMGLLIRIGISLAVGVIVSATAWFILQRHSGSTVNAGSYIQEDSVRIYNHRDIFIREVTTKRHIESSSSSSGGGSTTHRSSSGRTHGGGGRSF